MLNPGDPKALEAGCKCPADTNQHGKGLDGSYSEAHFLIVESCPLHGSACWKDSSE